MQENINLAGVTEHKFQDTFLSLCRSYGADAYSIVGSVYQSGRPDIDVTSIWGNSTKIELKTYRGMKVPTRDMVEALLHGPQRNVILHQLWARNANCLIVAHVLNNPTTCCILSRHKVSFDLVTNVVKTVSCCEWGTKPYSG